jgi:hypothetical protein
VWLPGTAENGDEIVVSDFKQAQGEAQGCAKYEIVGNDFQ